MINRTGLLIATSITAFVLVGFGLVATVQRSTSASQTTAVSQPLSTDKEAAYQQALADAQAKLEQANAQIADANARLSQQRPSDSSGSSALKSSATYAITSEQAGAAALQAFPGATLTRTPEVVEYQGTPAYEVALDQGMLYIDAQTGALLGGGVTAQQLQRGEHGEDEAREHANSHAHRD